jgi:hypothetical protein
MATDLTPMAYTAAELKEEKKEMAIGCNGQPNPYPWGLCLHLEDSALQKLSIKELPRVGTTMRIVAECEVTNVAQSSGRNMDDRRTVGLQITAMQISQEST